MASKVAADVARAQRERFAALSPADRVAFALRMSEEGLAEYMATHAVDRVTARARIAATRRAGRRPSPAADEHDR